MVDRCGSAQMQPQSKAAIFCKEINHQGTRSKKECVSDGAIYPIPLCRLQSSNSDRWLLNTMEPATKRRPAYLGDRDKFWIYMDIYTSYIFNLLEANGHDMVSVTRHDTQRHVKTPH